MTIALADIVIRSRRSYSTYTLLALSATGAGQNRIAITPSSIPKTTPSPLVRPPPSQRMHDYTMMQHSDQQAKALSYIPYSILADGDYTAGVGPMRPGHSNLSPKNDRYRTTEGVLSLAEYNRRSREFVPSTCQDRYRYLCADWVKYHYDTPLADELFKLDQRASRVLKDKGAGLRRADVERLRGSE